MQMEKLRSSKTTRVPFFYAFILKNNCINQPRSPDLVLVIGTKEGLEKLKKFSRESHYTVNWIWELISLLFR